MGTLDSVTFVPFRDLDAKTLLSRTFRAVPMTKAAISSLVGPVVQTDLVF